MARKVYLSMKSFQEITKFSSQYASNFLLRTKWAESMGYLFCKRDGDKYIIGDAVGISRGGETYVSMTPDDLAKIEKLDAERPDYFLGGWFHTHPGLSPFFSDTDILNQMFYQAGNEDGLGLVFDHAMVSPDFIGFKIFRLDDPQDPSTFYHDVEWTPLDWTYDGLKKAFEPLGIAPYVVDSLAYKFGLISAPPASELPPLTMPKIKDEKQAEQFIERTAISAETAADEGDYIKALISQRINIALLRKYGNYEDLADALLDYVEWALLGKKYLTAADGIGELDLLDEDHKFPEELEEYYKAKNAYLKGKLFQAQFQYSNAIENYEKAKKLFIKAEGYDEDCARCELSTAQCYEKQKEYKMAQDALKRAQNYAKQALNDARAEDEDEEDIKALEELLSDISRFQTRIKVKLATTQRGPTRIV